MLQTCDMRPVHGSDNDPGAIERLHKVIANEYQELGEKKTSLSDEELQEQYGGFLRRLLLARSSSHTAAITKKGMAKALITLEETGGPELEPLPLDPGELRSYANQLFVEIDYIDTVIDQVKSDMVDLGLTPEPKPYPPSVQGGKESLERLQTSREEDLRVRRAQSAPIPTQSL